MAIRPELQIVVNRLLIAATAANEAEEEHVAVSASDLNLLLYLFGRLTGTIAAPPPDVMEAMKRGRLQ